MHASRTTVGTSGTGKEGWETAEFPIVCETCLGDNPYIRMTKQDFDKECKVCARPFTVFRWKPGARARYKKTEVCQTCSKLKNCCQTCLLDLEYGLPLQLRDQFTEQGAGTIEQIPQSDVNREYFAQQAEKRVAAGETMGGSKAKVNESLLKLARMEPYYKRNRAHLCSFFAKGQCNRGDECPYRHEMPTDKDDPLANQNIKDRYYGVNDPVADKMARRVDDMPKLTPPEDQTITTLYVGSMPAYITDRDLRDVFYAFGEIKSIRMAPTQRCAFVAFTTREAAEAAASALDNCLIVQGVKLRLLWGKPQGMLEAAAAAGPPAPLASFPPPLPGGANNYFNLPVPFAQGSNPAPPGVMPMPPAPPGVMPMPPGMPAPPGMDGTAPPPPPGARPQPFYPSMDPSRMGARVDQRPPPPPPRR